MTPSGAQSSFALEPLEAEATAFAESDLLVLEEPSPDDSVPPEVEGSLEEDPESPEPFPCDPADPMAFRRA